MNAAHVDSEYVLEVLVQRGADLNALNQVRRFFNSFAELLYLHVIHRINKQHYNLQSVVAVIKQLFC